MSGNEILTLTAADVVTPGAGEIVDVVDGTVLVFTEAPDGRRIPTATLGPGELAVGCDASSDGARLLMTGLPGTRVRVGQLGDDAAQRASGWARTLGATVADHRWPARTLAIEEAGEMVVPGEHIAGPAQADTVPWVTVTAGAATLCDAHGATITRKDGAMPLPPGTWLTSGLRCRVIPHPAPADGTSWSIGLNTLARLAMRALVARQQASDRTTIARLEARSARSDAAATEAVDVLVAAVGGNEHLPSTADEGLTAELAAAVLVARATGLSLDPVAAVDLAVEVESGREPVAAVAAACGARPRPLGLEPSWWTREGAPMLVHVLDDRGGRSPRAATWRRRWVLTDATGAETGVDEVIARGVVRRAVEFLPVLPPEPSTLRDLGHLAFRGSRREIAVVLGVTALIAALAFATPYLLGQLSNLFIAESTTGAYLGLFGALLLVVLGGALWQAVRALAMLRARTRAVAIAAGAVWERLMRQRATWHNARPLGDRAAQGAAVNNTSAALPDETLARLLDTATVVGSLAAVWTASGWLVAALAGLLALQVLVSVGLLRAVSRRAGERVAAAATASGRLMELLRAVNRLRVAGAESRAFLRWAQVQASFARADQALRRSTMAQGVVIAVWPILALVVVVSVVAATGAGFGAFVTAQTAASAATLAIATMVTSANGTLVARQSLRMASDTLASVPEGGADGVQPGLLQGSLEVHDLVFRYGPDLPPALDRVSISVRPGEHVAVVGPSGCGKTTLMRVLLGLEDPESGVIAVDGHDMATLNRPAVRRQIGSVLQSSTLLPCSIRDNISMGRTLTTEEVWAALDAAAVGDDIRSMAMGIDTPVTDGGGTLSGGQRQRVLIARAMAGRPRMLILDEATSALDNTTQAAVVDTLHRLRLTRIVVAHRLSTIRQADRIIVMDAGRVVDEGTYDELVCRPGPFADLASRQTA